MQTVIIDIPEEIARRAQAWISVKDKKYVTCPFCGKELADKDLNLCCKCGAELIGSEKMNMEIGNDK